MNTETVIGEELGKKWGWLLALGILTVIPGTAGLGATFGLTLATVLPCVILHQGVSNVRNYINTNNLLYIKASSVNLSVELQGRIHSPAACSSAFCLSLSSHAMNRV